MTEKQLTEFFVEQRVLQPSQADDVLSEVELNGKTVAQAMIDGGFIDEPSFYETIANGLGTEFVDLSEREIAPEILRFIPSGLARLHGALPIDMSETTLRLKQRRTQRRSSVLSISFCIRRSRTARAIFISSRSKTNSKFATASMA